MPEYLGKHVLRPQQHLMIPEPKHAVTRAFENLSASQVVLAGISMLTAVEFNDHPGFDASEVGDKTDDRVLTAEAQALKLPIAEVPP